MSANPPNEIPDAMMPQAANVPGSGSKGPTARDGDTSPASSMTSRLVELETMVMHLQRDVDVLQEVIREQQQELKKFAGLLGRLDDRIQRLDTPGEFDAWSERPPHY